MDFTQIFYRSKKYSIYRNTFWRYICKTYEKYTSSMFLPTKENILRNFIFFSAEKFAIPTLQSMSNFVWASCKKGKHSVLMSIKSRNKDK